MEVAYSIVRWHIKFEYKVQIIMYRKPPRLLPFYVMFDILIDFLFDIKMVSISELVLFLLTKVLYGITKRASILLNFSFEDNH